jgi:hypothetical protein
MKLTTFNDGKNVFQNVLNYGNWLNCMIYSYFEELDNFLLRLSVYFTILN